MLMHIIYILLILEIIFLKTIYDEIIEVKHDFYFYLILGKYDTFEDKGNVNNNYYLDIS